MLLLYKTTGGLGVKAIQLLAVNAAQGGCLLQ